MKPHINSPEVALRAGLKGAARVKAKHRRELMREIIDAQQSGKVKTIQELVMAFARELASEVD